MHSVLCVNCENAYWYDEDHDCPVRDEWDHVLAGDYAAYEADESYSFGDDDLFGGWA